MRGAYMEKEALRAKDLNYKNPIQPNKAASDLDYNAGLAYCIEHIDSVSLCAGTHNEESCKYLITLMQNASFESK